MSVKVNNKVVWNGIQASKDFDGSLANSLLASSIIVQNAAVKNAPKDKGALKASIDRAVVRTTAYVGTPLSYAPDVEFGTRPHVIKPKTKKFLAFKIDGKTIFTKQVNHPGTKAQPYLRPALLLNINKIKQIFKKLYKAVKYVD